MAPTETIVEWQTSEIIKCLLQETDDVECRQMAVLESDGPADSEDSFDPVAIAEKLRSVADALNDDIVFKAALNDLKKAAAQEAAEAAFSHGVEALCKTQISQSAEVTSEMQLIRASAALGLYVIKSSPDLKNKVCSAMNAFLNSRVRRWVTQQGGWDRVNF